MELRQYFTVISKWLWLIFLSVAVAAVSAFFASRAATPLFLSKTTLMVGRAIENPSPSAVEINTGQQLAQTYSQLARREPVLRGAIERLGLRMRWESLSTQVRTVVVPQTQLLEISVVDSDPTRAHLLADAIAQQLIQESPTTPSGIDQEQQEFTQGQIDDLETKIEKAQTDLTRLKDELDAANSSRLIQDLQNQIGVLENKINNWQNTYSQLLLSLQGGDVNVLTVIEPASTPTRPFSPNVNRNVMTAAAIGLILAIGGAFLVEYLDDTVKTPEDVTRTMNLPTLGMIFRIDGQTYPDKLVPIKHPLAPVVETYRLLRTNLQYSAVDRPLRTLMLTSPGPGEGKSITLSNLAIVIAQAGLPVILVDTDLRRPVLHRIFGMPNRMGLTDSVLHSDTPVMNWVQETGVHNLRILSTGPLPPNPAELLSSTRMREVIDELKEHAAIVLFDSPPCLFVADAAILGSQIDGVILVNDVGRTRSKDARAAVQDLQRVRVNLLGVVLNRLKLNPRAYYQRQYIYKGDDSGSGNGTGDQGISPQTPANGRKSGNRLLGTSSSRTNH